MPFARLCFSFIPQNLLKRGLRKMSTGQSRIVPGRYPEPGADPVADAIRARRGNRGLTPLDANLLHVPGIASGYNNMLGAIRTQGKLPGDIREAMILRIAALNHAAFEWIQHEPIGRKEGLTTGQLYVIRDADTPLPTQTNVLDAFQTAAVSFSDHSTRGAKVPWGVVRELKSRIRDWVLANPSPDDEAPVDDKVDDLYVEAAMVVASYNMVSRFLLSTDVAGLSDSEVPWPLERKDHFISMPSFASEDHIDQLAPPSTHTIHAVTLITSPDAPWLVFCNSLLTDYTMWNYVVPNLLDLPSSRGPVNGAKLTFNILLHSQRGHGRSTLPPGSTEPDKRLTTIPLLAHDVAHLLKALDIATPVRSVIGVSQGGAAAIAFAALYGSDNALADSIVACDTSSRTPTGNKEAWEERIRLVLGPNAGGDEIAIDLEYARRIGMVSLANATVPRWFPPGSFLSSTTGEGATRAQWVKKLVENTDVEGFIQGARALSDYHVSSNDLVKSRVKRVLLLAGSLDGNGKVGKGLKELAMEWKTVLSEREGQNNAGAKRTTKVEFLPLEGCGHLPMIDSPHRFYEALASFITEIY